MGGRRAWLAIGIVLTWIAVGFTMIATCGCYRVVRVPVKQGALEVKIVEMPNRATCYLSEVPAPPALIEVNTEIEDVVRRVFLHYLQANEIIQWQHDMRHWVDDVRGCLYQITGQEP